MITTNEIANLYKNNGCKIQYTANKLSDDFYIVTEPGEDGDYYIPHIVGKSNPENGFVSYRNYDEALLNGLAIKYSNGADNTMVSAVKRLLGMMED